MQLVSIDGKRIYDWNSFHDAATTAFGFPAIYGRNLNALVDCLTSLDRPEAGMSRVHAPRGGVVTVVLNHVSAMKKTCPDVLEAFRDACAFVNWRRVENGETPVLALAWNNDE